jgi:phosphatidylglycerophosphate synthase
MPAAGRRLTIEEARRLGQGSSHLAADPTYARLFIRRVSPVVSWAIVAATPLSADAVTATSIASGIVGGVLVAVATPAADILAVILLQLAYLLDVADGEVARIRGTAGLRGTYLDLIGHVLQNRALYVGAAWTLITVAGSAPWAILTSLLALGFAVPFGYYARLHVLGAASGASHPDHATSGHVGGPVGGSPLSLVRWLYRRVAFVWAYPASMNLFCLALLVDAARSALQGGASLAVPGLFAVFGLTLAAKQVGNALRLVGAGGWRTP